MRPFPVSFAFLFMASSPVAAQKARAVDIGLTGGSTRDYYRFEFGPKSEQYIGVRADAQLIRTKFSLAGLTAQFDTYRYNAIENYAPCPNCLDGTANPFLADVRRVSIGPYLRRPIGGSFDIVGTVFGGWAKRQYMSPGVYRGALEDESSHSFYSAEVGAGISVRGFRLGVHAESGFMQRVRTGTRDNCITADPFPGTTLDCHPLYGARSFTRMGLAASYRVAGVRR